MKHCTKILTAFSFTSFVLSQIVVGGNVTDLMTGKPMCWCEGGCGRYEY